MTQKFLVKIKKDIQNIGQKSIQVVNKKNSSGTEKKTKFLTQQKLIVRIFTIQSS
jgi:hypothetical protein